jgi:hypothetical protein
LRNETIDEKERRRYLNGEKELALRAEVIEVKEVKDED